MKTSNKTTQIGIMLTGIALAAAQAKADLTVVIEQPNPAEIVNLAVTPTTAVNPVPAFNGAVYAGIYNVSINGVSTPGFCIDVAHDVYVGEKFTDYSYSTLASSPDMPAGPMGLTHAINIEKLWAAYYGQAQTSAFYAASLQLAIWESEGGASYGNNLNYTVTGSDYGGYTGVAAEAGDMLGSLSSLTATADLTAIVSPDGQAYVIAVPEPTTLISGGLLALPFGAGFLRFARKRLIG